MAESQQRYRPWELNSSLDPQHDPEIKGKFIGVNKAQRVFV